jgi:adenine-specific DNA-methyltransferase
MNERIKSMQGESLDLHQQDINRLKEIFPEVLTDGEKIDFDKLKDLLAEEVDDSPERYNFTWNGKREAIKQANTPTTGTLLPNKEKSKDWDTTQNLYIEGDNLEVLKLLQKSYAGKVKMIYIDPPYNTGKDFVYKDDFHNSMKNYLEQTGQINGAGSFTRTNVELNGRFHTDWLNMIFPRLKLARNLLTEDGVMFVSVDDAEIDNMTKVIKEVFGEKSMGTPLIWRLPRGINAGLVSKAHEYILVVTKSSNIIKHFNYPGKPKFSVDRTNKKIDGRHPASLIHFPANKIRYEGKDQTLSGEIPGSEKVIIHGKMVFKHGMLASDVDLEAGWTMKKMIVDWLQGKDVYDTKGQKIDEFFFKENGKLQSKKIIGTQVVKSVLDKVPDNQAAREEIETLFGNQNIFSYPKPSGLIKYLAGLVLEKNDIILDFFAGSGTTAQAILDLNDELNLDIKYILVQLPEDLDLSKQITSGDAKTTVENAIAKLDELNMPHKLTYLSIERIRRVSNQRHKITTDVGFKVFELAKTNIRQWDSNPEKLEEQLDAYEATEGNNFVSGRTSEDVVYELLLKQGLELTDPIEKKTLNKADIYIIDHGALYIVLGTNFNHQVADFIASNNSSFDKELITVIFQDIGFKNDSDKLNVLETLKNLGFKEENIFTV